MQAATVILLIVATAIINTECFRILDKRQGGNSSDEESCVSGIVRCVPTLIAQPFLLRQTTDFGTLAPEIDQICQEAESALGCVQPYIVTCPPNLQAQIQIVGEVLWYFCGNEGRSMLREFQESVCYDNFPNEYSFWISCLYEQHVAGLVDFDQAYYTSMYDCVGRRFTEACGEAGGQILSALFRIYNRKT